jgi:hypothetical protein
MAGLALGAVLFGRQIDRFRFAPGSSPPRATVGKVYSANTVGPIAGALLAGFLLVPSVGVHASMIAAAGVNVSVGTAVLAATPGGRRACRRAALVPLVLLFTAGAVFPPGWDRAVMVGGVSIYVRKLVDLPDTMLGFRQDAASRQLLFYQRE